MDSKYTTKPFPGFNSIYWITDTGSAFRGMTPNLDIDGQVKYTRCEAHPKDPVEIRWYMGKKIPMDIIRTASAAPIIVSQRVILVLRENGFSGWSTYDVRVFDRLGNLHPGYTGLSITGRCGPIDNNKSIEIMKQYPTGMFPAWQGIFFNPETWDGSDLFMTEISNWIFTVKDVVNAFKKNKIRGYSFKPIDKIVRAKL